MPFGTNSRSFGKGLLSGTAVSVGEDHLSMLEQCREIVRPFSVVYAETLRDVRWAMRIDYFENGNLMK